MQAPNPCFAPPKTKASRRTIPMPAFVETALRQHIKQFVPDGDDRLITTTRGRLLRRSQYDQDIIEKRRTGQKFRNSKAPIATRRPFSTPMATRTYEELHLETY